MSRVVQKLKIKFLHLRTKNVNNEWAYIILHTDTIIHNMKPFQKTTSN